MRIINKTYNIKSNLNKCIVLISDIHYSNKKDIKVLNYVLDNIKKIKPNYICIPGDIIDKSKINDEGLFIEWFKKLSIICKVIVSIGNHEFYINKNKKEFGLNKDFFDKLSNINNLYLLDNKNIIIDDINFIGLTHSIELYNDESNNLEQFNKNIKKLKTNKEYYNVLLCHSPVNVVNSIKLNNIDLVLCGHMHGGVVPNFMRKLFKNDGFINPHLKLFPKNVYGYIKRNNTNIIITSGIRVLPFKLINKIFNPEVVKINLTNKKN